MKIQPTNIADVLLIIPKVFEDERGFFYESYNHREFTQLTGLSPRFVQDNHSRSLRRTLRGLHYQIQQPQGKLVRVIAGKIFDVAVDLRQYSSTFGQWTGCVLSSENRHQLWIPIGFAHGFLVLSESAEVLYKTTDYYAPQYERCLFWNDRDLAIDWSIDEHPILSKKDKQGMLFKDADLFT
ncbi:dTDP-4-dehydrorhamnose 3,5-epimerase [Spirulina sp. 06S082]|uniref:dTDP-4-dehydrorhamnose 3,5-epimerase n=1 Tax=Spirulina sp. 06S082 TaxID=3110248 RepID=UPI002B1FEB8F|nr:dTDP-4-dehydrorhamnose 3,5-epimerase [Spirulina sp. 06S082]MEA5469605.1 dTDP-4-dehydrorhamnose 3,5-epimerase [Spirulina sp. 06S082]